MNNKEKTAYLVKFMHSHPLDFAKANPINYKPTAKDLPMYKWVKISSAKGVGFVHAYKLKNNIVVRSDRYYSKDMNLMTHKEFDDWRKEIKTLLGQ